MLPCVLCGPETLQTDEGATSDSCFCPFPPADETLLAVHWDVPGVWPYSGKELATLQSVYPESAGQESGKLTASTQCWVTSGTPQWLGAGEVSADLWVDFSVPEVLAPWFNPYSGLGARSFNMDYFRYTHPQAPWEPVSCPIPGIVGAKTRCPERLTLGTD